MILIPIKREKWKVFAYCRSERSCDLLEQISNIDQKYSASCRRLFAIIDKIASEHQGPLLLPDDISHQIDKQNQIYEFIAGKLRLLWFYSPHERKVIICTNFFMKKTQKTPRRKIEEAINIKKRYDKDYKASRVKIIDEIK